MIDYLPAGQTCRQPRGELVPTPVSPLKDTEEYGTFWIDPKDLGPDETLVVVMHSSQNDLSKSSGGSVGVMRGPVAPCVPVAEDDSDNAPGGGGSVEPPSSPGVP
ncbi:hypothetical protein AB0B45_23185 [Nonomuraea sp. NPDC049152]|uniref:hypothetical protein n=1 Tax=Nonomuraea sp. NPDC049152 TaxID=3154350 RepID=UPI0033F06367